LTFDALVTWGIAIDKIILSAESIVRLGAFLGVFGLMALWELLAARRTLVTSKKSRWLTNLTITLLNVVAVRFLPPILPLGMAILAEERAWGLLNNVALPEGGWLSWQG